LPLLPRDGLCGDSPLSYILPPGRNVSAFSARLPPIPAEDELVFDVVLDCDDLYVAFCGKGFRRFPLYSITLVLCSCLPLSLLSFPFYELCVMVLARCCMLSSSNILPFFLCSVAGWRPRFFSPFSPFFTVGFSSN